MSKEMLVKVGIMDNMNAPVGTIDYRNALSKLTSK